MSTNTTATSGGSVAINSSTLRNGSSIAGRKILPCRLITQYLTPFLTVPMYSPLPGLPSGKFAGRSSRGSCGMYSRISRLSQLWFPPVSTAMSVWRSSSASRGVMPKPEAEFSPLARTRSIFRCATRSARRSCTIWRPGEPTMSPIKSMRIKGFGKKSRAYCLAVGS